MPAKFYAEGEERQARIKELQDELDAILQSTEDVRVSKRATTHSIARQKCARKIKCLQRYGYESTLSVPALVKERMQTMHDTYGAGCNVDKMLATKEAKYGYRGWNMQKVLATKEAKYGNKVGNLDKLSKSIKAAFADPERKIVERIVATKLSRYGHVFGDFAKILQTKLERYGNGLGNVEQMLKHKEERYGNHMGDVDKMLATKEARYGDSHYNNSAQRTATKLARYGHVFTRPDKIIQTNLERYGNAAGYDTDKMIAKYGVPHFCMSQKYRNASKTISKLNKQWCHDIESLCKVDVDYEFPLEGKSFDLHIESAKLLIEICPTISHNSTVSFARYTGKSKHNKPYAPNYHHDKLQIAERNGYRLLTIWDWDDKATIIDLIASIINNTEQLKGDDIIELDLSKESIACYDNYELIDLQIDEHVVKLDDNDVVLYGCGIATLHKLDEQ